MNNNKISIILLGAILAVGLGILIVSLQPGVQPNITFNPNLGFSGYNELGYSGMTQATTGISVTVGAGTNNTVLTANSARMYARIFNETASGYFTIKLATNTTGLVYGVGVTILGPGEAYVIDADNLWVGGVFAIASNTGATATLNYAEK